MNLCKRANATYLKDISGEKSEKVGNLKIYKFYCHKIQTCGVYIIENAI